MELLNKLAILAVLMTSVVAFGGTPPKDCSGYLQLSADSVTQKGESSLDGLTSLDFVKNTEYHVKQILYSSYVESFPVDFTRAEVRLREFGTAVDEILKETGPGDLMSLKFSSKVRVLEFMMAQIEAEYFEPKTRELNLDVWYLRFGDVLADKIKAARRQKPESFSGTEQEWENLLDSLFVPKARFYPYAKKSLKRKIKSVVSDIRGIIAFQRGRVQSKTLRRSPVFLSMGALLYLGSFITVHGYAEIPPGGYQILDDVYYDWLPYHEHFHDFAKNNFWLYLAAPAVFNAYSLSYVPYALTLPVSWTHNLLGKIRAKKSQKVLARSSEEMARILSQHLSLNRLSLRKLSKTLRTPVNMNRPDRIKARIARGGLNWDEVDKIYRDIGQAIRYTSSSVSAFMLYDTNPLKNQAKVLKEHLQYLKTNGLDISTPLTSAELRAMESERQRSLRVIENLGVLRQYVLNLVELLELLQEALPELKESATPAFESPLQSLDEFQLRHRHEMATGIHVSILSLRQLLGGLENYQNALVQVNGRLGVNSPTDSGPQTLLEDLQSLEGFFEMSQMDPAAK